METLKIFNNTLLKFKENLKKIDDTIEIKKIGDIDTIPLQNFLKAIDGKEEKIKNKDSSIFNESFNLDSVDLSAVFAKISKDENRESVWKYLNTLVLISKTIKTKSKTFEEMFEKEGGGIQDMMEMLKNMMGGDTDADADSDADADDKEDSGDDEDLVGMLENSKIGNLAKDIASTIDISSLENIKLDSPDINSIMSSLSSNDSIKGLMNSVTSSLKEKMETGELNHADLKSEALQMFEKLKKNKKIKKMMKKGGNMQGLMKEMMKQQGMAGLPGMPGMPGTTGDDEDFGELEELFKKKNKPLPPPDFNALRGGGRRNSVRKRLKKKLEKKED
jgi:hypothetical protein